MSDVSSVVGEIRRLKGVESDWNTLTGCLGGIGKFLLMATIIWWRPFSVMLALGMLHSYFPVVPALGFWGSWLLVIAVSVLKNRADFSGITGKKKDETVAK